MSVEFSNTYQEILLDNLVSIIKQNFVFQTQLKLSEKIGKEKADLQAKFDEVNTKYEAVKNDVTMIEQLRARADVSSSVQQEKDRIQIALNDTMKKNASLNKSLEEKDMEILKLQEYIKKLEEVVPSSKLKKINPEKNNEPVESATPTKVDDGSSF